MNICVKFEVIVCNKNIETWHLLFERVRLSQVNRYRYFLSVRFHVGRGFVAGYHFSQVVQTLGLLQFRGKVDGTADHALQPLVVLLQTEHFTLRESESRYKIPPQNGAHTRYPHLHHGVLETLELVRRTQRLQPDVGEDEVLFPQLFLELGHFRSRVDRGGWWRTVLAIRVVLGLALYFGDLGVSGEGLGEGASQLKM